MKSRGVCLVFQKQIWVEKLMFSSSKTGIAGSNPEHQLATILSHISLKGETPVIVHHAILVAVS
jgi:hypothetical protein